MKEVFRRIYSLLLPQERKEVARTSVSVFINALLDFVSLATLLPVLYYLLEGGGHKKAALLFCLLAISVSLVKFAVSSFLGRYQLRFQMRLYRRLSFSLYDSYYRKGLLFIRKKGSVRLGHEVNNICFAFSQQILGSLAKMAADAMLITLVAVALLIYSPMTALVLFVSFLPFATVYLMVVRKNVKEYGKREMEIRREQRRIVSETYSGYAELEVNDAFPLMKENFLGGMDEISTNKLKMDRIMRLPAFLSELAVICGLTLLAATGTGDIRILVGIFAVAAFRLMPALRSVMGGWTIVQNASYCIDILEEGLNGNGQKDVEDADEVVFNRSISFEGVTYSYPDGENIFTDFNCTIQKGEYVGFSGYSGAGKSTLFNLLLGFLQPDEGKIMIDGKELTPKCRASWLTHVGYVPQDVFIFDGSLADNVAIGCKEIDKERVIRILEQVSLGDWLQTLPEGIDTALEERGGRLSGGQRQRIGIARALYREVDVLLLDEATSALDNTTEQEVNDTLQELKLLYESLTILSIAHRESTLGYCDRVIEIHR